MDEGAILLGNIGPELRIDELKFDRPSRFAGVLTEEEKPLPYIRSDAFGK
jgi:hypothetical protein